MSKLEKYCKIHGQLNPEDIKKEKNSLYKVGYYLRCKKCVNERTWRDGISCKTHGKLMPEDLKSNGRCKKCHRSSANTKRNNNRDWFNEKMAEDRIKNPEKWSKRWKKEYQNSIKNHGREARTTKEILRVHGLTQDQYDKMLSDQESKCKICREFETRKSPNSEKTMRLVVDHCHETKEVRGLLCHNCNTGLGKFKDDMDLLEMAIMYLQEFKL